MKGMMGNMNGKIELDKIVGCFKKDGISVTFILTNPFHYHLSLCVRCVGLYLAYLHYFYQHYVFHGNHLVLVNLIRRYVTSTSDQKFQNSVK